MRYYGCYLCGTAVADYGDNDTHWCPECGKLMEVVEAAEVFRCECGNDVLNSKVRELYDLQSERWVDVCQDCYNTIYETGNRENGDIREV